MTNVGELRQQLAGIFQIGDGVAVADRCAEGIQMFLDVLRLREARGHTAGAGAVGHIPADGPVGLLHTLLQIVEGVQPDFLSVGRIVGIVPEQAGQLEQGHLVALTEPGGVGDGGLQAGDTVPGIVGDVAQEHAGLGMLVDGVVQPEADGLTSAVCHIVHGGLGDGGVHIIAGPVEDDGVIQMFQGIQLRTVAGPGAVVALGAVGDGLAAHGDDELLGQTVEHRDHIGMGAAAEVIVEDVEFAHTGVVKLGQLGNQFVVTLLIEGGIVCDAQAAEEAAQMDAPDIAALGFLSDADQLLDPLDLGVGVQVAPAAGVVGVGLGGVDVDVHLHIPGELHELGASLVVPAAVEALDKAPVLDEGVVLDLRAQEQTVLKGGQHHFQGRHTIESTVAVAADDGDLLFLCLQQIAVVTVVEV